MANSISMQEIVERGFTHLTPADFNDKIEGVARDTSADIKNFISLFSNELKGDTPIAIFHHPGALIRHCGYFDGLPITLDPCCGIFSVMRNGEGMVSLVGLVSLSYNALWGNRLGIAAAIKLDQEGIDGGIFKANGDFVTLLMIFESALLCKVYAEIIKQLCPELMLLATLRGRDKDMEYMHNLTRKACAVRQNRTLCN